MSAIDQTSRQRAIDPSISVIVQAPAGSGKTELLTQRFLALLATVEKPESILAITFTRKAVGEMRHRIIQSLRDADKQEPMDKAPEVKRQTRALAESVLARDKAKQWHLLENPSRLQIMTIDALCAFLGRQLPIAARFGAALNPAEDPRSLYEEAVEHALNACLAEQAPCVTTLLRHFAGNGEALKNVVVDLLQSRAQWLPQVLPLHQDAPEALKSAFEKSLRRELDDFLCSLERTLAPFLPELAQWSQFAQAQADYGYRSVSWCKGKPADLASWKALADWLLTQKNEYRSRVTKKEGFPANKKEEKAAFTSLLSELKACEGAATLLGQVRKAPDENIGTDTWDILHAATEFAIRACAELKLVMARTGQADFPELAIAALDALGDTENPSELELMLDARLQHILVDEFQDTSLQQLRLLKKLTQGWQRGDGRTIMVVGDPMQSIYRFRDANVTGFTKVQQEGIGDVRLENIQLQANFRSSPAIVEWVNDLFGKLFTPSRQLSSDAVRFARAIPQLSSDGEVCIQWLAASDKRDNETEYVYQGIQRALREGASKDPSNGPSVAVLARSRNHLDAIAQRLRQANVEYQAVELASLMDKAHIHDLVYLMLAMHQPLHPVYVPAVLRSNWLGLKSTDILGVMTEIAHTHQPFWQAIDAASLTDDGQHRVAAYRDALVNLQTWFGRVSLTEWLQQAWQRLAGEAMYGGDAEQDLVKLFTVVDKFDNAGRLEDIESFLESIKQLRADAGHSDANVHLMTIHKAKGLEFDEVFVIGLDRAPRSGDSPLFLWERNRLDEDLPLMAASGGKTGENSALYEWLKDKETAADSDEALRVLYVACTRAKRKLHLVAELQLNDKGEVEKLSTRSLLGLVPELLALGKVPKSPQQPKDAPEVRWWRNLVRIKVPKCECPVADIVASEDPPQPWQLMPRLIGRVIHAELELAVQHWPINEQWAEARYAALHKTLQSQGLNDAQIEHVLEKLSTVMGRLPNSKLAELLDAANQVLCEPQLVDRAGHRVRFYQPDLVIFHDTKTYLIDYKTAEPDSSESWETFVQTQWTRYQHQLEVYMHVARKVGWPRCQGALYFPSEDKFSSWIT